MRGISIKDQNEILFILYKKMYLINNWISDRYATILRIEKIIIIVYLDSSEIA